DADEDQDDVDQEQRRDVIGDVAASDREHGAHRNRSSEAATAASIAASNPPRSSAFRPASVAPPGGATAAPIASGSRTRSSSAVPARVSTTSRSASSGARPSRSPGAASAAANRAT